MKALEILLNGIALMEEHIKSNPKSEKEIRNEIEIYKEAVKEIKDLKNRSCNECKHYLDDNGNYPLEPCSECSRFYSDKFESK